MGKGWARKPEEFSERWRWAEMSRVLVDEDARAARFLYWRDGWSIRQIAGEFGVSVGVIRALVAGETYRSAGGPHSKKGVRADRLRTKRRNDAIRAREGVQVAAWERKQRRLAARLYREVVELEEQAEREQKPTGEEG